MQQIIVQHGQYSIYVSKSHSIKSSRNATRYSYPHFVKKGGESISVDLIFTSVALNKYQKITPIEFSNLHCTKRFGTGLKEGYLGTKKTTQAIIQHMHKHSNILYVYYTQKIFQGLMEYTAYIHIFTLLEVTLVFWKIYCTLYFTNLLRIKCPDSIYIFRLHNVNSHVTFAISDSVQ